MSFISDKTCCAQRNKITLNQATETRELGFQRYMQPYQWAPFSRLSLTTQTTKLKVGSLAGSTLSASLRHSCRPSPLAREHTCSPACLRLLFFITQQMTYLIGAFPLAGSPCQPSARIKPAALFIFILSRLPSTVFFLKIVCQHRSLGCAQWNRLRLLN